MHIIILLFRNKFIIMPVIFLFTVTSCNTENIKNDIVGKWQLNSPETNSIIEFTGDGFYKLYIDDQNVVKFIEGGILNYSLTNKNDSTFIEITNYKGEVQISAWVNIVNNELVMDLYNTGAGTRKAINSTLKYRRL